MKKKALVTKARCGLCGKTTKLTKTECCDEWICDDEASYQMFSFSRNSCSRNHRRYTLCAYHYNEGHSGDWAECSKCLAGFDTEDYVESGTNEYNFRKLAKPPSYAPTLCIKCGGTIVRAEGGYSVGREGFACRKCSAHLMP